MLTLQVLNSDAQLNAFMTQSSFSFTEGSDCTVVLRIYDAAKKLRYIPATGATFEITLVKSDGSSITKVPSNPFSDDRSIISFDITAAEANELISQAIVLKITEGSTTKQVLLRNGFSKILLQGC